MKIIIVLLILMLMIPLYSPAFADHSVLPDEGDMNETQALDRAIDIICREKNIGEDKIRGHWFFTTCYYESTFYYDAAADMFRPYDASSWSVSLVEPNASAGYEKPKYALDEKSGEISPKWDDMDHFIEVPHYDLTINARDGGLVYSRESIISVTQHMDYQHLILVPEKTQLQPQEALDSAYESLAQALRLPEEDVRSHFRDYRISGSSALDTSRCWYHVELNSEGNLAMDRGFHVYLDMDSGGIVFQTDADMIAGRYALWQQGINHGDWFKEQLRAQEDEWGQMNTWDYRQYAAFEKRCFGRPFQLMNFSWGLPGTEDCTFVEAETEARKYLAEYYNDSRTDWSLTGSCFWADYWGDMEIRLSLFNTEPQRMWQLNFRNSDGKEEEVFLDPASCKITDGGAG